jgi:hypothetical protein
MLSFEISVMDVVLLVVMMVLLLLFIKQRSQSVAEPRPNPDDQGELLEEPRETKETPVDNSPEKQSAVGFQKCVHQFGYLRNMPKNTPIPDECFGCPTVMRCLFPNVQAPQVE